MHRYDRTKKANIGKRRNICNSHVEPAYVDHPQDASHFVQESPYGGIDLPSDEFYQTHALSSTHPPPHKTGHPPKTTFQASISTQKSFKRYDVPSYVPSQIYKLLR